MRGRRARKVLNVLNVLPESDLHILLSSMSILEKKD